MNMLYFLPKEKKFIKEEDIKEKEQVFQVLPVGKYSSTFFEIEFKNKKKINYRNLIDKYIPSEEWNYIVYAINKKKKTEVFPIFFKDKIRDDLRFIPESFIFKGEPSILDKANFFVFKRSEGYEQIFYNGEYFISDYFEDELNFNDRILFFLRKIRTFYKGELKLILDWPLDISEEIVSFFNKVYKYNSEVNTFFLIGDIKQFKFKKVLQSWKSDFLKIYSEKIEYTKSIVKTVNYIFLTFLLFSFAFYLIFMGFSNKFSVKYKKLFKKADEVENIEANLKKFKEKIIDSKFSNTFQLLIKSKGKQPTYFKSMRMRDGRLYLDVYSFNINDFVNSLRKYFNVQIASSVERGRGNFEKVSLIIKVKNEP